MHPLFDKNRVFFSAYLRRKYVAHNLIVLRVVHIYADFYHFQQLTI